MERLALMAVIAHPGDELAVAGTLARYARAGVHVALVCATPGAAGRLGAEREHDLRCACLRLGIGELHNLGFAASTGAGQAAPPQALVRAPACEVVRRLVHLMRAIRPQVVLTFEPNGIDGQADHVAIGGLASQAFGAAGDLQQFPRDGGPEPHAPARLYRFGLPEGLLRLAGLGGRATPDDEVRTRLDVAQFVDAKLDAARCYRTPVEQPLAGLLTLPPAERRHLLSAEFMNLAQPQPAVADATDEQLFAGIP